MTEEGIPTRIQAELVALKSEEANLNHKYKAIYHLGGGSFNLLPDLKRVRKRQVELKDALRIMKEFERE